MGKKPTPKSDEPIDGFVKLLGRAHAAVRSRVTARLSESGLDGIRPSHAAILPLIDTAGSRITVLADRAGVTKQAMGQFVDDLAAKGLLQVAVDGADKRLRIVRLTEEGAAAARMTALAERQVLAEIADEVGRGKLRRLQKRLLQLATSSGLESESPTSDS